MTPAPPKLANSVASIAVRCDVCTRTVRGWIAAGKLKALRIGGRVLVAESEILRFLSEAEKQGPAEDGPRGDQREYAAQQ